MASKVYIGKIMRIARMTCGAGLREFAEQCDLSPSYYCQCENGDATPDAGELAVISRQLRLLFDALPDRNQYAHTACVNLRNDLTRCGPVQISRETLDALHAWHSTQ